MFLFCPHYIASSNPPNDIRTSALYACEILKTIKEENNFTKMFTIKS